MIWKDYSRLKNTHAFLSPSKHYWINYSSEKLVSAFENYRKIQLGSEYHNLAERLINLAVRLPNNSATFNSFVNDAIGFRMRAEVVLYFSDNCYGTADAISFYDGVLRIHDLKTGRAPGSIDQLLIYAGLFFLDYGVDPREVNEIYLRIYQNEEVLEYNPAVEDILHIVDKIREANKIIEELSGV